MRGRSDRSVGFGAARWRVPWLGLVFVLVATVTVLAVRGGDEELTVSPDQRLIIDRLESVLLHDTVVPQYDRVVYQFDSRGYVAGIGDFSTAGGEVLEVVEAYTARVGANALSREFLPVLRGLAAEGSGGVDGLAGFADAWRLASADPVFRRVQDDVLQSRYFEPARDIADELGITTPLGLAIIYDSLLQHGGTDEPDALPALIERTNAIVGGRPGTVEEQEWLGAFLDLRVATVAAPSDPGHREVWPPGVGRVEALVGLLADGRDTLAPPFEVNPYGTAHVLVPPEPDPTPSAPGTGSPTPDQPYATTAAPQPSASVSPSASGPVPRPTRSARPGSTTSPPAPVPSPPRPTAIAPTPDAVVRLVSRATGGSVGVSGGSTGAGALIVQSGGASDSAQQWRLIPAHSGCYHLLNIRSGMAMDNPDGSSVDGVQMQQYTYFWGNTNQAWCFQPVGGGWYTIRNLTSGSLLDLRDGRPSNGTAIQQWGADPAAPNFNQSWRLIPVG